MTWFTENPMPPVLIGVIVAASLAVVLARTGKRSALWGLLAVVASVVGIVVMERMIVTPREEVRTALEEIRGLVAANKPMELVNRIDNNPGVAELRNRVQRQLSNVEVTEAKITDLRDEDILISNSGNTAKTTFIGSVNMNVPGGQPIHFVLKFEVELHKKEGVWLITEAKYGSVMPGAAGGMQPIP